MGKVHKFEWQGYCDDFELVEDENPNEGRGLSRLCQMASALERLMAGLEIVVS